MVHVHNGILLGHKKERNNEVAATWMDRKIAILSEENQRKTNIISLMCGI